MKLFDLTGRKAIVTGATRGLGRGMAEGLMEAGCEVVAVGSSESALKVAREFQDKGFNCHGIAIDLADRAKREAGFAQAVELLAGRQFIQQGSKGKIVNIASMLSFFGGFTVPAYAASKGGVAQLTKALSNEWSGKGINVNAIAPGYMATEMNTALINDEGRNTEILSRIPAHRWGTPEDMKGLCIFLASDASDYIDGAVIPCDGGYLAK